uniref:Mlo2 n=1 Tax=Arundo donax TaxID=35708 RepID=A0A0A9E0I1_ARUDO
MTARADAHKGGLMPTTVLKSSSNDLLMYFRKLNLVPGDK